MSAVLTQLDGTLLEHTSVLGGALVLTLVHAFRIGSWDLARGWFEKQIALALGVSAPSVAKLLAAEGFGKRASAATVQVALGLDSTAASEPTMEELVVRDIAKG